MRRVQRQFFTKSFRARVSSSSGGGTPGLAPSPPAGRRPAATIATEACAGAEAECRRVGRQAARRSRRRTFSASRSKTGVAATMATARCRAPRSAISAPRRSPSVGHAEQPACCAVIIPTSPARANSRRQRVPPRRARRARGSTTPRRDKRTAAPPRRPPGAWRWRPLPGRSR